ncbi:Mitochondrial sodium/hydrogen exchanger 9B2 [Porphyridium purpureum]|uniref:Mitochondrial sodium/hydrogen exchanger 9B2 n=1 Tax=Porphyridium purpureum TaxID=35688 RepID=A0A5J4Z8H6_PORPP|nr:Mitochondrial sodium/hydrogen exchanger 9B2 [Porphyridium purpureum]|eukprot:POR0242..scf295_1
MLEISQCTSLRCGDIDAAARTHNLVHPDIPATAACRHAHASSLDSLQAPRHTAQHRVAFTRRLLFCLIGTWPGTHGTPLVRTLPRVREDKFFTLHAAQDPVMCLVDRIKTSWTRFTRCGMDERPASDMIDRPTRCPKRSRQLPQRRARQVACRTQACSLALGGFAYSDHRASDFSTRCVCMVVHKLTQSSDEGNAPTNAGRSGADVAGNSAAAPAGSHARFSFQDMSVASQDVEAYGGSHDAFVQAFEHDQEAAAASFPGGEYESLPEREYESHKSSSKGPSLQPGTSHDLETFARADSSTSLSSDSATQSSTICGRVRAYVELVRADVRSRIREWVVGTLILALLYALLFLVVRDDALPFGALFSLLLLWVFGLIFGILFDVLTIPSLLGSLLAGIVLVNVPGDLLRGLEPSWIRASRRVALSFVLLRAGLSINVDAAKRVMRVLLRFGWLPGIIEAVCVGAAGTALLGMPWALSLAMGFIEAAGSAAVIVTEVLHLEHTKGLGVDAGIGVLLLMTVTTDIVTVVSGYTLCFGLAVSRGSLAYNILFGPINILVGAAAGVVIGALLWFTGFVQSIPKMALLFFVLNLGFVFLFQTFSYTAAAALSAVLIALVAKEGWRRGLPGSRVADMMPGTWSWSWLTAEPEEELVHVVQFYATQIWKYIVSPLLFASIGAVLDFREISGTDFGKSAALVAIGCSARIATSLLVLVRSQLLLRERLFVTVSMCAKATIQASLGGLPLAYYRENGGTPEELEWGRLFQLTSSIAILLTAPLVTLYMRAAGPVLLKKPPDTPQS